jgi:hypothetical protein
MPGIANLNVKQFQALINRFDQRYVLDWTNWINTQSNARVGQLGVILRRWQACRPNRMRRTQAEKKHDPPYLDDLVAQAARCLRQLQSFDIRSDASFTPQNCYTLIEVWKVFQGLSYHGRARNGLAGVVGISKAVLLLTDGRVGPAFDSEVRRHLKLGSIDNANQWIEALQTVSRDIGAFETKNQTSLHDAAPRRHAGLHSGRIYDMALGPGE